MEVWDGRRTESWNHAQCWGGEVAGDFKLYIGWQLIRILGDIALRMVVQNWEIEELLVLMVSYMVCRCLGQEDVLT